MSYIQVFQEELAKKLQEPIEQAALAKWISDKVVESYKNGLSAGRKRSASGKSPAPAESSAA